MVTRERWGIGGAGLGRVGWAALGLAVACARPTPAANAPAAAPSTSASAPTSPADAARSALVTALGGLPPGDVLGALPAAVRSEVRDALAALRPEDQATVRTAVGAVQAPLLHLAAGGNEPGALLALATGAAAQGLVEVRLAAGRPLDGLGPAITAVANAAAQRWLADVALELATPSGLTERRCAEIDRAAEALGRNDLRLLAARAALALGDTPRRQLAVAVAAARELSLDEARAALAAAERERPKAGDGPAAAASDVAAPSESSLLAARAAVAAAELVTRGAGGDEPEALVQRGRAWLLLGRPADARELIAPHRRAAEQHLALAATLALAELGGTACPGLPGPSANLIACAASWRESTVVERSIPLLEMAWTAGTGRDRAAIEAYLGLVHVMPWLYSSLAEPDADPAQALARSLAAVTTLERRTREAAASEPSLAGLVLFVELLRTGFETATARTAGERGAVEPARRAELEQRALALAPSAAAEPLAQVAMLGVAALLSQETDPGPVLAALPPEVDPRYRVLRGTLELWRAVARGDDAAAERGRATFQALIAAPPAGVDRSHLVLTLAEADAALRGRPTDYATLYQVATRLDDPSLPRATRLRLVLDRAGALDRTDRAAEAITLLVPFAEPEIGAGSAAEVDLAAMARAYLVVLRAREATGAERAEYAARLGEFTRQVDGQVAAGVSLWHGLWMRELAAREAAARCRGAAGCLARVERARPAPPKEIEQLVGGECARMVARGTVPLGAVTASFQYSTERGLEPRVALDPLLLAVALPPPAGAPAR